MRVLKKTKVLFGILCIVAAGVIIVIPKRGYEACTYSIQEKGTTKQSQQATKSPDYKRMPISLFDAPLPADSAERALRQVRSGRYDKRYPIRFDEDREHTIMGVDAIRVNAIHWWMGLSALPAAQSDAIAIGRVTDANAYVSNDKTGVYSEFAFEVERKLKGDDRVSGVITIQREGGAVQLQDGHVIKCMIARQHLPDNGSRYLMCLRFDEIAKDYEIITGYELRSGKVFPLDDGDVFSIFRDLPEASFLETVQAAVK